MLSQAPQTPIVWNPRSDSITKHMLIYLIVLLPLLTQLESYAKDDNNSKYDLWYFLKLLLGFHMICCIFLFLRDVREMIRVIKAHNPTISNGAIFDEVSDIYVSNYLPGCLYKCCSMLYMLVTVIFSAGYYIFPLFLYFGLGFYLQFPYKSFDVKYKHSYLHSNALALALGYKIFQSAISSILDSK